MEEKIVTVLIIKYNNFIKETIIMENQKVTTIEGREVCEVETILEDMILKMKQQFDESLNVPKISKEVELSKEIRKLIECLATVRRTSGNLLEVGVVELPSFREYVEVNASNIVEGYPLVEKKAE